MTVENYLAGISIVVFILALSAAGILYSRPDVFQVPAWVKTIGIINFMIDVSGGLLIFGRYGMDWEPIMGLIGTAKVMTSMAGILGIFLYVHLLIIPNLRVK